MGKKPHRVDDDKWRVTVRFPRELEDQVNAKVEAEDDRTLNWWIVRAVQEKLARDERKTA